MLTDSNKEDAYEFTAAHTPMVLHFLLMSTEVKRPNCLWLMLHKNRNTIPAVMVP